MVIVSAASSRITFFFFLSPGCKLRRSRGQHQRVTLLLSSSNTCGGCLDPVCSGPLQSILKFDKELLLADQQLRDRLRMVPPQSSPTLQPRETVRGLSLRIASNLLRPAGESKSEGLRCITTLFAARSDLLPTSVLDLSVQLRTTHRP